MQAETMPDGEIMDRTPNGLAERVASARGDLNAAIGQLHALAEDGVTGADEIRQHVATAHRKLYGGDPADEEN